MTNRYSGKCIVCGCNVKAYAGTLERVGKRWTVKHLACQSGKTEVYSVTFSSGQSITRNVNGTCIDAPCCGCCTF